jgi:hypothetical protein
MLSVAVAVRETTPVVVAFEVGEAIDIVGTVVSGITVIDVVAFVPVSVITNVPLNVPALTVIFADVLLAID